MSNIIGVRNNNTIVPYQAATKRTKELDFSSYVTSSGWTCGFARFRFEADSTGIWRVTFNFEMTKTSGTDTTITAAVAGIKFKNISNSQPLSGKMYEANVGTRNVIEASVLDNSGNVYVSADGNANNVAVSGNVLLEEEPTTYTTAANMEGVTAVDVYIPPASATEDGIVNRVAQTFAGVKTFSDGALIKGRTDGAAVAAGYVGEILAAKLTGGTNGNVYYDESATTITTTSAITVSRTVNKGNYLCTFDVFIAKNNNTSVEGINVFINIGGTNSGSAFAASTINIPEYYTSVAVTLPLEITADSTVVGIKCSTLTESARISRSRMSLIRIS